LHQRAGSQRVLEVHGTARELVCLSCRQVQPEDAAIQRVIARGEVPYCGLCGGTLKPNVVLFGEMLPFRVMQQVEVEIGTCDLILVVGSSLEVQPACWWPQEALQRGARAIIVNYSETYLDELAEVAIHADVAETLPALVAAL
jgi:NAD-dependent deacetylase